jgi:putative DNA methylase
MTDKPRLNERAFPLKQASLDWVHEKNVRHGDISTVHIGPARPGRAVLGDRNE